MILYEHEGKTLLEAAGIMVPKSQLVSGAKEPLAIPVPCILKAQTLSGKRAKAGGIIKVASQREIDVALKKLFSQVVNGEEVTRVLIEEVIEYEQAYYLSFSYDSESRQLALAWSAAGGTNVEENKVDKVILDILNPNLPTNLPLPQDLLAKLLKIFLDQDCLLLEINPLVKSGNTWVALDAKIKLDDAAMARHQERHYAPRSVAGHRLTEREAAARAIDEGDHRGTAGSAYLDLEGDIAVLASGGGASLVAMDALLSAGGKAANYTEYSGNPPREKVERLTEIVLSKPGLKGLWIIGAVANFTDIHETLSGIVDGLRVIRQKLNIKLDFPIVVRRGGPRAPEALAMLRGISEFDFIVSGPEQSIEQSAKVMVERSTVYSKK